MGVSRWFLFVVVDLSGFSVIRGFCSSRGG